MIKRYKTIYTASCLTVFSVALLAMPAVVNAMSKPFKNPVSITGNSSIETRLNYSKQEMKRLNLERKNLQKNIKEHKNVKLSTRNISDLQDSVDQAFVLLHETNYDADIEDSVLFTDPEQLITDLRAEWVAEYIVGEVVRNMKNHQKIVLEVKAKKTFAKKNHRKLVKLESKIANKKQDIAFLQEKIKIKKHQAIVQAKAIKKTAIPVKIAKVKVRKQRNNSLLFPVNGTVIMGFGDKDELGTKSRGLVFQADTNKSIVSPRDGIVRFAEPFNNFKQLLIIEHDDGYHSLISGFDKINVKVGKHLLAGEEIGRISKDKVYYELRHNGIPIDPSKITKAL